MLAQTLATLLAGAVFGLALAAPPGPMNAIIAEESVLRGWRAGFTAGLGAMVADLCFLALSLAGLVTVVQSVPGLRGVLFAIGGLLMLFFGVDAARGVRATLTPDDDPAEESKGFRRAFVLALTNPYQILFWLTVGVGLLTPGTHDLLAEVQYVGDTLAGILVVETGSPTLLVGFFGGIACWIVGFPAGLVAVGERFERLTPVVAGASALVLGGFGVAFCWAAVGILL
jgi:threonine/homoserine/homoserine lactone efflux protein